ncbi:hypothetical protein B4U37_07280 [Sutcliffiella horikoshii]|uniref:Uncharacterized protein n=1 Tax=Sutcliffiella horikoshii TaxID=79883 RepID=A0ABN4ZGN8_9BACI|nr:hypothetical protein [Sutcliffiella horikoshii]ART75843.1 hypothetical protein B4U37_07280 [Sutcliffiella horikoshii]
MSLYYEYKFNCYKKEDDHKEDHKHEQDCFCGKFPKYLLGQEVVIGSVAGAFTTTFRIACIDEKSGLITFVVVTPGAGEPFVEGQLVYVCCKDIAFIAPVPAEPLAGAAG